LRHAPAAARGGWRSHSRSHQRPYLSGGGAMRYSVGSPLLAPLEQRHRLLQDGGLNDPCRRSYCRRRYTTYRDTSRS
jgi:hypothetical protein